MRPTLRRVLPAAIVVLLAAALVAPATADETSPPSAEPLQVTLPAKVKVGQSFMAHTKLDPRLADSATVEGLHHRDGHAGGPGAPAPDGDWSLEIDFGDDSGVQQLTTRTTGPLLRAKTRHAYATAGRYEVVVTGTVQETVVTATATAEVAPPAEEIDSPDRYATAVAISEETFTTGTADAVLLARGDSFPDALAASSMTVLENAPLLLTRQSVVPDVVLDEIARVLDPDGPRTVYVFGGEAAIGAAVHDTLTGLGYDVVRFAGADRVGTALLIAEHLQDRGVVIDEVLLARADSFADALATGAFAARNSTPVLLTARKALDPRVADFLAGLSEAPRVHVLGGPAAIHPHVVSALTADGYEVARIAGADRYATSVAAAEAWFPAASAAVVVTGDSFADALAGAGLAARLDAPLLLVGKGLPEPVREFLTTGPGRAATVVGGPAAVPEAVRDAVRGEPPARR